MREGALDATDVIAAALHDRRRDLHSRRRAGERQILGQQLALQGLRSRRNDDALPTHGGGYEVRKAFANAGCRLGHQHTTPLDRAANLLGKA